MEGSPLSNYYKDAGLSPVEHDIASAEKRKIHLAKRLNLLEYHLKLPRSIFHNLSVLEFGPGSGENISLLAQFGALVTVVEPVDFLIEKLKKNLLALGVADALQKIYEQTLETFKSHSKYDFVIAEGFVQFLDDPAYAIKKLFDYVEPGGFLFISLVHPSGTFVEFIKKVFLLYMIESVGATTNDACIDCARLLFYSDFKKINHSRSFESWVGDTLLNPLYRAKTFIGYETIAKVIPDDFYLYSSWPNIMSADDLVWHKNVKTLKTIQKETIESYYSRFPHFVHSVPRGQKDTVLFAPSEGKKLSTEILSCIRAMDRQIDKKFQDPKTLVKAFKKLAKAFSKSHAGENGAVLLNECAKLFSRVEQSKNKKDFAKGYASSPILRRSWGSPGHYYVLQKRDY